MENTITKYEPRVSVCLFDLTQWFLERTNRFPKNWRVTLGDRIDALLIDMMSKIQRATVRKDKLGLLESVNEDLDVLRGGGWDTTPTFCRSAYRDRYLPTSANRCTGFRVVCGGFSSS